MATQVQMAGADNATQQARTKAAREWDINTTYKRPYIGDGSTPGGIPVTIYNDELEQVFTRAAGTGTNAITYSLAFAPSAYVAGQRITIIPQNDNTTSVTLNGNSLGAVTAKKVKNGSLVDLEEGDLIAGVPANFEHNGTYQILLNPQSNANDNIIASEVISGSPTAIDFEDIFESGYNYSLELANVQVGGNAKLYLYLGTSGSSFITSGYSFATFGVDSTNALVVDSSTSSSVFVLTPNQISPNDNVNGDVLFKNPMDSSNHSSITGTVGYRESGASLIVPATFAGEQRSAAQATASLRIDLEGANTFSSGTITIKRSALT